VSPVTSKQSSKLLGPLFDRLDLERRITILEVGSALPETVDFFSAFKCRIHFADIFDEPLLKEQKDEDVRDELEQRFKALLNFPDGTQFDICLLWDVLNYLDRKALQAFCSALRPFVHEGSRAHGFGVLHASTQLMNQQYGIHQLDTISVRTRRREQLTCYPHSQVELNELLTSFDFERGLLQPDGKLEILLRATV
jgi:hypothetical protein